MSLHFYPLRVKKVYPLTNEAVRIDLEIPAEQQEQFTFQAGQYLTFKTLIDGAEVRRSYSICSSPLDDQCSVGVKLVEGGLFSSFAHNTLKAGDILEVIPPNGKFIAKLDPAHEKHYLAIAAGSGITPILSLIKTVLSTELRSQFTLLFGNKNVSSIMFREDLESLKNVFVNRFAIYHVLSREKREFPLFNGRMDVPKCQEFFDTLVNIDDIDEVYLCGPEDMTLDIKAYLLSLQFPEKQIHLELFNTPGEAYIRRQKAEAAPIDASLESNVRVKLDGNVINFKLKYGEKSILDAAMDQGADLPYACKGGVCCTCKAKLLQGEVAMDVNYGLEQDEIEAGYILTCQSHPRSSQIFVDFDTH